MKRKLLLLLVLVIVYFAYIGIRLFVFEKETLGRLRVVATPDAEVFINGAASGKAPYEASLPPGEYTVKIAGVNQKEKIVPWDGVVQVNENTLTYVSRELAGSDLISAGEIFTLNALASKDEKNSGELIVESDPPGALVYVDNDQKGITPLKIESIVSEEHEISLYLPGFFRRSLKIRIEDGHALRAQVKLALDQSYRSLTKALEEEQKRASEEAKITPATLAATDVKTSTSQTMLVVRETPTGYLNVRSTPGISGTIVTTVAPGDSFTFSEEKNGWYKISTDGKEGWISGEYVEIRNQ